MKTTITKWIAPVALLGALLAPAAVHADPWDHGDHHRRPPVIARIRYQEHQDWRFRHDARFRWHDDRAWRHDDHDRWHGYHAWRHDDRR